jgi:hypothetical protein
MNQLVFDYLCDLANNKTVDGLVDDNVWEARTYIIENFNYQDIYNQIDNLLENYLVQHSTED